MVKRTASVLFSNTILVQVIQKRRTKTYTILQIPAVNSGIVRVAHDASNKYNALEIFSFYDELLSSSKVGSYLQGLAEPAIDVESVCSRRR